MKKREKWGIESLIGCLLLCAVLYFALDPVLRVFAAHAANLALPAAFAAEPYLRAATMKAGYNIIFIVTDQERYFSSYPEGTNFRARERLRTIGTTFEKHYVCSNMSTSSRSVIYTGAHITDTKLFDNTDTSYQATMNPEIVTVGDRMRSLGYYTAFKGKCHFVKDLPEGVQQQDALEPYGFSDWNAEGEMMGGPLEGYLADPGIVGDSIGWLRGTGASLNADGTPFFLSVNLVNPHDIMYFNTDAPGVNEQGASNPLMPIFRAPDNPVYRTTYTDPIPATWNAARLLPAHAEYQTIWSKVVGQIPARAENWERFRDYYYNTIQDNDNELIKLLDELEALGMMERTIIVMTSDHGEMQGVHGMNGKGANVYEHNIHVPLFLYHPDFPAKAGASVSALTSHLDLAATFIAMTDADADVKSSAAEGLAGRDILPLLDGTATDVREEALFACSQLSMLDSSLPFPLPDAELGLKSGKRGIIRGLITEEGYKFSRYFSPSGFNTPTTLDELYRDNDVEIIDLKADPDETENIADQLRTTNPELVASLNARLNALIAREIGTDDGREFSEVVAHEDKSATGSSGGCSLAGLAAIPLFGAALFLSARWKRRR